MDEDRCDSSAPEPQKQLVSIHQTPSKDAAKAAGAAAASGAWESRGNGRETLPKELEYGVGSSGFTRCSVKQLLNSLFRIVPAVEKSWTLWLKKNRW